MPAELHWLAVGLFSTLLTLSWLFVERRLVISTLLAGAGWSWMTLTGADLTRYTETGAEIAIDAGELAYLCLALAVVSWLALGLHLWGHYPPRDNNAAEMEPING